MSEENSFGTGAEMPKYKCHKEVWALQIREVLTDEAHPDTRILTFVEEGYAEMTVARGYFEKHRPVAGGYFVVYQDGYKSFSPAEAFEDGYHLMDENGAPKIGGIVRGAVAQTEDARVGRDIPANPSVETTGDVTKAPVSTCGEALDALGANANTSGVGGIKGFFNKKSE